ncbi:hypothetical protein L226DRAFT_608973 [Lentinus tigrinus ALCF2SS1-7]|uniref:F-box domain-containing protein n=1 Tax=Lentinus tigrinus ALCF2SS1-6 TaxID=1328759 RepID=A0A5C2SRU1_9APHY|nr:hypothetical protein L227DRAFT_648850 [Lentinus tigrinus ALCF2SS1-6]RPD79996.1 hypothetical protein L226DRAFT_608973 [Lentinus tigrinus ALCF2SS1-7]
MPPRKRTKKSQTSPPAEENAQLAPTARRNVRGRRGGLKDMPNMPLDVLMEIFGFMHPKDLLNLARTSKAFRSFLMNRAAQPLWKASMARVDNLPSCPAYMTEPQYINLLFFNHCHNCLKTNVQTVCFESSARYCGACKPKMFVEHSQVSHLFGAIRSVAPNIESYLPAVCETHSCKWHKPDFDVLEQRWNYVDNVAAKEALAAEYGAKVEQVQEATKAFKIWRDLQKARRSAEIEQIKGERIESIKSRLRQEGWGDDLDWMQNQMLYRVSFEKQFGSKAEALTERGWTKIRDEAVSCMERIKKKRLDAERRVVLRSHFNLFAKAVKIYRGEERQKRESDVSPHMVDLAVMDEFRAILDVPESADLSVLDNADEMRNMLDAAQGRWREERKKELTVMVKQSLDVPEDVDPLTLACALFRCDVCGRGDLQYPAVVAHICARGLRFGQDLYGSTASAFWSCKGSRSPWSTNELSFSTSAASLLRPILQASGLDPNSATIRDVEGRSARLICEGCSGGCSISSYTMDADHKVKDTESYKTYDAYDCRDALAHSLKQRNCRVMFGGDRRDHRWKRVTEAEEEAIVAAEKELPVEFIINFDWDELLHGCAYCEYIARRERMPRHLRYCHDIDIDATEDDLDLHCYDHYDGEPTFPDMSLRRYDDGRIKAEYAPRDKMLSMLSAVFGFEPAAFDYDNDGLWDSDSDDSDML